MSRALRAALGALLALLSSLAFAPAFGRDTSALLIDRTYLPHMVAVVVLVCVTCVLLDAATGIAPITRVLTALAMLFAYVLLVIAPGAGLAGGPKRLLTSALPVDTGGSEFASVVVLVGLAALCAVEPALRRRSPVWQPIAPLAMVALGCATSAAVGPPTSWLAVAMAGVIALLLAVGRQATAAVADGTVRPAEGTPDVGHSRRLSAVPVAALLLTGAAAAGWGGGTVLAHTGDPAPADVRALIPPPAVPRADTSPLVLFPALRSGRLKVSFTVQSAVRPERLRYASLNRFDGQHWNSDARYRRAGRTLPPAPNAPLRTVLRDELIQIRQQPPLGWIVSSGRPVEVSKPGLLVDEVGGDVALPLNEPSITQYRVNSAVPVLDKASRDAAVLARVRDGTGLPPLPAAITGPMKQAVGEEYGYPALERLEKFFTEAGGAHPFRADGRPDAPSGHGILQIQEMLKSRQGTAEQYASAFAVMARALGFESRVVVGFTPKTIGPDTYVVSGEQVHAWAEVRSRNAGWIPFNPTPKLLAAGAQAGVPPTESPSGAAQRPKATPSSKPSHATPKGTQRTVTRDEGAPWLTVTVAAVLAILLLYLGLVPTAKTWLRSRRRTRGSPQQRTIAAWQEVVDRLVDVGVPIASTDTTGEVVAATTEKVGGEAPHHVRCLAALHGAAVFAPTPPSGSDTDRAWREADLARHAISGTQPRVHRWRARLSTRSFRHSRRLRP
ncbi:DUF3488 and transglutaminase-like domain-containing protein [Actinomadura livida]|uniref:Transglutaminase-like domain-containing protein n=1 Tax=Actinomadura livida TaxID=79909 RepID=A0A7W7MVI3_9ACTN|nr:MULTISPECIES: transglutaminase domain-containing protein [Actinomadura]MBB4771814.1 hypothetical protein [Actinomadura catellatispora]GGU02637.1 hypothetical protein GCM10010208_28360 [Actinomadura livida]